MQHTELFIAKFVCFFSQGFDTFRADETFCDVVLVPGDSEEHFLVHRVIMASSSDYFKAMFTGELDQSRQHINAAKSYFYGIKHCRHATLNFTR